MRGPVAWLCLVPLLLLAPRGGAAPDEKAVERAREILAADLRDGAPKAIETLAADGSRESLEAISDFGARTLYAKHAILAGKALDGFGETKALARLSRLMRAMRKFPPGLARIALMLEQIPGRSARELLEKLARDNRSVVAAVAIRSLGARKEETSRDVLTALVKSSRPNVASAAAFALSQLEPRKPTMELLFERAQKGRRERVGDSCALALSTMEGAEPYGNRALALLIKRSSSDSFHAMVKLALRLAKSPDPDLIDLALRAPSKEVREVGCDLVGLNRLKGYEVRLHRLATTQHHWKNQVAAWLALKRSGIEGIVDDIASSIRRKGEESYWAIQCAGNHPRKELLPNLRDAALDEKDPVRRELAQRALRRAVQERKATRDVYLEAVAGRDTRRAEAALLGIGNLKDKTSFETLLGLLEKEEDARRKLAIVAGLEKLTGHYFRPDAKIWREWAEAVGGDIVFQPQPIDRTQNRERVQEIQKLGISPRTEAAVENGLLWLARHQDESGAWSGNNYHENCIDGDCAKEGGIPQREPAYTGLAVLAFLGAGYSHQEGPYRDLVQRAYEYILAQLDYDGSHVEASWTFSYESAILCQALCDGYALTGDPWLGEGAQRMIDYLVKIQYPGRTWRYRVRSSETDTSVMSWILLACVSARTAGLDIPEQIYVASEAWLETAADPVPPNTFEVFHPDAYSSKNTYFVDVSRDERGKVRTFKIKTWYQPPRLYTPSMPAIGLLSRVWMGWTRAHPFCIGSANQLLSAIPGYNDGLEKEAGFYPYTWYYGSLAMYQMGGRYWQRWREKCLTDLIKHQRLSGCEYGSWEMPRAQFVGGLTGGTVYCTAMAILTLETFYRYKPYLARHKLRSKEAPKDKEGATDSVEPGGEGG